MKASSAIFLQNELTIAHELDMSLLKFKMILERYNITKNGIPRDEFKLRGLVKNYSYQEEDSKKINHVLMFSIKGKKWAKKLIPLLDSDITTSDWVE